MYVTKCVALKAGERPGPTKRQHTFAHWGVPSDDWEYRFASPPGDILRLAQELKMAIKGRHHQLSAKGTKPDVKRVRSAP